MFEQLMKSDFDREEWTELVKIADGMDLQTRVVLCEYGALLDRQGEAITKHKLLAKTTGMKVRDVRKCLTHAKDMGWLEQIEIDGRKGYRATLPN